MKRAQTAPQTGSNIAVFVLLLGLFLAIYVLLLPPEDRENLLNQNFTENPEVSDEISKVTLLEQKPGIVRVSKDDEIIHKIDSLNLYSKEEPRVTDLASSLYLKKSLFSKTERNLIFKINDLENIEKVNLLFLANQNKGNLIIDLNDIIIYDAMSYGLVNIVLPKDLLHESNNLKFSVSSPGLNIFGKNIYTLSGIKIRENYELTNTRESRDFALSDQETGRVTLSFFLYCNNPVQGSRLRIFMNNNEIKNEVVSCTTVERNVEVERSYIESGVNTLMFQIEKGDYIFSEVKIKVKTDFKGVLNYKFSITEDEFDKILSESKEAVLSMYFNDDEKKRATISVNGKEFSIDTNDIDYERDISRLVKEGNNFIRITPSNEFNIDLLRIILE